MKNNILKTKDETLNYIKDLILSLDRNIKNIIYC